jgi:ATP-binding cassette subfamily B protein
MIENLRRLFRVLDRWKWHYVFSGVLLVAAIFVRSLEPKVIQITVDNVITYFQTHHAEGHFADDAVSRLFYRLLPEVQDGNAGALLLALGFIYVVISLARAGLLLVASALTASSTEKAIKNLRDVLFAHIQKLPMSYFTRVSRGELIQRSTGDIDTVKSFIHGQVVDMIRLIAIYIFAFIMMYLASPVMAFISILLSPVMIVSSYLFFKKERKVWEEHEAEADKLNEIVHENLNGIRTVKAFANEEYEMEKFDRQNRRKLSVSLQHAKLHTFFWPLSDLVVYFQITASIITGGYFAITGQITVGELMAIYTYVMMIAWPMRQIGRILSKLGMSMVSIERIYEVLTAEKEAQQGNRRVERFQGEIEFRNVSFKYDKMVADYVLKNVSFKIRPGEKVAIIGPTGAGKSTIINLLVGLYDADEGSIFIDGEDIRQFSKQDLRKKIGFVLQTPFLFSTTVKENMAYANPGVEEDHIERSARIAQVHTIEEVLPNGYDTLVGEKGVTLSGGQKQRVALARTLVAAPDILILDDVTSAVDTQTEFAIFEALSEPMCRKTTIIISHRITSIQQADRILALENGRIVQEGTDRELESREGYYQKIHAIQSTLEEEILQDVHFEKNRPQEFLA